MSKYKSVKTVVDGITFDSKREAARYQELKLLERGGLISKLELQPKFPLIVGGKKVCTYIGDFRYLENGHDVVEDVKSEPTKTSVYRLKRKLLMALAPQIWHREV